MSDALGLLERIGERLANRPGTVALLGLGSAGTHRSRFDEHSDLDFFVITADKPALLTDLGWLGEDLTWVHRNTVDGYKVLAEGVFCEFAVFTPDELPNIAAEGARVVWARPGYRPPAPNVPGEADQSWLSDEILSNLYVGLHRWLRGERLAAMRMIQHEALGNLLRLLRAGDDPFDPTRRAERGGWDLGLMAGGYDASPAAAEAILGRLPAADPVMRAQVAALLARCGQGGAG